MSGVPAEARGKQKLKVIMDARRLCKYSLTILQSNKNFKVRPTGNDEDDAKNPPQPELVSKMRDTVMDIFICAYSANETYFSETNYRHRRQLQDKSVAKCNELLALVEMSIPIFHINYKRVEYWTNLIVLVRNQIQAWKESDYKRYKRIQANRTGGVVRRISAT